VCVHVAWPAAHSLCAFDTAARLQVLGCCSSATTALGKARCSGYLQVRSCVANEAMLLRCSGFENRGAACGFVLNGKVLVGSLTYAFNTLRSVARPCFPRAHRSPHFQGRCRHRARQERLLRHEPEPRASIPRRRLGAPHGGVHGSRMRAAGACGCRAQGERERERAAHCITPI